MNHLNHKGTLISIICWEILRARNDIVWNDKHPRAGSVVNFANAYLSQWQNVQDMIGTNPTLSSNTTGIVEHWVKPQRKSVKANCDATIFSSYAQFGVGWIARDVKGELISALNVCYNGNPEIHCKKAIGIRDALSWIKQEFEGRVLGRG